MTETSDTPRRAHYRAALVAALMCALCVAYINFFGPWIPNPGDLVLALPIAKELASPGLYSPADLVVSSGLRMPFHVYRLASLLYARGIDVDVVWYALYQVFLFATLLAVWALAFTLSRRMAVATACAAIVSSISFFRGSLHWSMVPITALVTAQVAMPVALAALVLLWRRCGWAALVLAGLTFDIHPYVGLITVLAVSSGVVFGLPDVPFRRRLAWLCLGAIVALPNACFILRALPANFAAVAEAPTNREFYEQFRIYAWHAFVEDHWREGYGWVALQLAGLVYFARYLEPAHRRLLRVVTQTLLALMAAYLVNLYWIRERSIILMFLFRATYLLKALLIATVANGVFCLVQDRRISSTARWGVATGLTLALFAWFILAAEAIALIAYAGVLAAGFPRSDRSTRVLAGVYAALGVGLFVAQAGSTAWGLFERPLFWDNLAVGVTVAAAAHLALCFHRLARLDPDPPRPAPRAEGLAPALRASGATAILVIGARFTIALGTGAGAYILAPIPVNILAERIHISESADALEPVTRWARERTPRGSLFIVPPDDAFLRGFRFQAERGVLATTHDVNQLAFDTSIYREAHRRLQALGVRVLDRHRFDSAAYHTLSPENLVALRDRYGVDYALFYSAAPGAHLDGLPAAFHDESFVVFNLKDMKAALQQSGERGTVKSPDARSAD